MGNAELGLCSSGGCGAALSGAGPRRRIDDAPQGSVTFCGEERTLARAMLEAMESTMVTADDGVDLHIACLGSGHDVVVLSGGPGCVHYLADEALFPAGCRWWFPDPRGVGSSGGGPHDMARAIDDLECIRRSVGIESWHVLGHSWGSDLGVRYALDCRSCCS